MYRILKARWQQGKRTIDYPMGGATNLSDRFRGRPRLDPARCAPDCYACAETCPTDAIHTGGPLAIDLGACLFCTDCVAACPDGAIAFSRDHRLAARSRAGLVDDGRSVRVVHPLADGLRRMLGRSLRLRQVSAGGCNACEADTNVLGTVVFDLGRFGIQFVASPRHADGLLITGPVSRGMELALRKTWEAVPSPRIAVAVGACAISGGPYSGHEEVVGGADRLVPIDLYVPGCPPHPLTILDGLLRLLGRLPEGTGGPPSGSVEVRREEGSSF
jgi:Ni,Fe-hydrogenase III small subunit/NAD-dependent dihydropyrimidine dehydrogenase PreA subunit